MTCARERDRDVRTDVTCTPGDENRPCHAAILQSSDHVVRAQQQRLRDGESERLRRPEVDHQLELRWLLDRQLGGLGTLEDLVSEARELAIEIGVVHRVGYQAAG